MILKNIVEICVAIDIAILGIAYPIILNKISSMGDKYSSNHLSIVFRKEFPQRYFLWKFPLRSRPLTYFEWILFATIISFIFLIIELPPLIFVDNWFMMNSSLILVLTLTILLVITFIIWLDKVALYTGKTNELVQKIIGDYKKIKHENETKNDLRKTLYELTCYTVKIEDETLLETFDLFYSEQFNLLRKDFISNLELNENNEDENLNNSSEGIIYPIDFYILNNKIIELHLKKSSFRLDPLSYSAVSSSWLLGSDFHNIQISEQTYNWIWNNVSLIANDAQLIKEYWRTAHKYFWTKLPRVPENYNPDSGIIENQKEINNRNTEQNIFLEFHIAIGGLLFYLKNYDGIKNILNFTQSQPPTYYLLPKNIFEILNWFVVFKTGYSVFTKNRVDYKYRFPDRDSDIIFNKSTKYTCKYIVVLFIRQYLLQTNSNFQKKVEQPSLPTKVYELKKWQESLEYFYEVLIDIIKNDKLLSNLEYNSNIETLKWHLYAYIENLQNNIEKEIHKIRLTNELSPEKIQMFKDSTTQILEDGFIKFELINNIDLDTNQKTDVFAFKGGSILFSRQAFIEDDIPNINFDSFLAEYIVKNHLYYNIPYSFVYAKNRRYTINKNDIGKVLEKLNFDDQKHIIIGVNFARYHLSPEENQKLEKYLKLIKHIPAIKLRDILFVLPKSDLPKISHIDLDKEDKIKNELTDPIIPSRFVYASVVDLMQDKHSDKRREWNIESNPEKSLILNVSFIVNILWKSNRDVVQLVLSTPYEERGLLTNLDEITPFN